jgi:formate dehydrogenase maturation protein FdhE
VKIISSDDGLVLSRLDIFLLELLRQIPVSADPADDEAARKRLFSQPSQDAKTSREWEKYVHPELAHIFQSANETVKQDLDGVEEKLKGEAAEYSVRIPAKHFDSWLNSLNQARLALAARNHFAESDLEQDGLTSLATVRDLSLFQIHFYGFLQECIVREIE